MPETAIDEYDEALARKEDIDSDSSRSQVHGEVFAEPVAEAVKNRTKTDLGLGI